MTDDELRARYDRRSEETRTIECRETGELPIEPSEPGWYASAGSELNDYMIFLRMEDIDIPDVFTRKGKWMAFTQSGTATECDWAYIAQAGPVVPLTRSTR